jgi:hypothetical protein
MIRHKTQFDIWGDIDILVYTGEVTSADYIEHYSQVD